jgi:type IV pilus assembly protein PilA
MTGNYTSSVNIPSAGQIKIIYGNKANKLISGSVLYLNAYLTNAGDIDWVCGNLATPSGASLVNATGSTNVTPKYLPKNCQS